MASSAAYYKEAAFRFAAQQDASEVSHGSRELNNAVHTFHNAKRMVAAGGSGYEMGVAGDFRELAEELLAEAVRASNIGDPFTTALVTALQAAEAAVAIPGWDTRRGFDALIGLVDTDVLVAAVDFGKAASSVLGIAITRANAARAEAAAAENLSMEVRGAEGVSRLVDATLGTAAASARFNAVWNRSLEYVAAVQDASGTDAYRYLEHQLLWEVMSAANDWHAEAERAARLWDDR